MSNEKTTRPWWKLGLGTWLGIILVAGIGLTILTGRIPMNRQIVSWIVFSLDPYTWPLWIAALLWCAVLWKSADLEIWPKRIQAVRQILRPASILIFLGAVGYQNNWHLATQRTKWYQQIYLQYIIGPLAAFIQTGKWDWKIFILPCLALLVLTGLVVLLVKTKRMKAEEKERKSEALRGQVKCFVMLVVIAVLLVQIPAWIPNNWKTVLARESNKLYMTYIVNPMTSWLSAGYCDWKTFLFPAAGLLLLGGLIFLALRLRRKNRAKKD